MHTCFNSHYSPYSGGEIYLANIYCQNEDKRKKLREKEKPLVLIFLLSKFSFVYITKIKKLHISLCNESKCGKCKIAHKVLDSSCFCPDFTRKQLEYCIIMFLSVCACQWPRSWLRADIIKGAVKLLRGHLMQLMQTLHERSYLPVCLFLLCFW